MYRVSLPISSLTVLCSSVSGLADVSEGEVNGQELQLASTSVGRISFGVPPAVKQVV